MILVTHFFLRRRVVSPKPNPEDHPLSFVRGCIFNILAATLHSWRPPSIRNLMMRHAAVTGNPSNMAPKTTATLSRDA
jgi:hypothetical protein